jgi:hypothetical protein
VERHDFGCGEDGKFFPKESCTDMRLVGEVKMRILKKWVRRYARGRRSG